jgi:hypothetical protein
MNKPQWIILASAMVIFALSVLFPPWLYRCEGGFSSSAGYHFFSEPPAIMNVCPTSNPLPAPPPSVVRNGSRQGVQVIIVFILAAGLLLILQTPRTNLRVVIAVLIICTGVVGLWFLGLMIQFEI